MPTFTVFQLFFKLLIYLPPPPSSDFQILNFDVRKIGPSCPNLGQGGGVRGFGQCPKENVFFLLISSLSAENGFLKSPKQLIVSEVPCPLTTWEVWDCQWILRKQDPVWAPCLSDPTIWTSPKRFWQKGKIVSLSITWTRNALCQCHLVSNISVRNIRWMIGYARLSERFWEQDSRCDIRLCEQKR